MMLRDSKTVTFSTVAMAGALVLGACSSDDGGGDPTSSAPPSAPSSAPAPSTDGSAPDSSGPTSESGEQSGEASSAPSTSPTGGESSSGDAPSGSESSAPSGSTSPTSDAGGSPSASDPGLPPMPAAAKQNSEEGAEAFARWYVETLNHLYQHPQTGVLDKYASDNCKTCAHHRRLVENYSSRSLFLDGDALSIKGSRSLKTSSNSYEVVVAFRQNPVVLRDAQGEATLQVEAIDEYGYLFELRHDGRFRAEKILDNEEPVYQADGAE